MFSQNDFTMRTPFYTTMERYSNVLTVVKSATGHVFGGFVLDPFNGTKNCWIKGNGEDFTFSLTIKGAAISGPTSVKMCKKALMASSTASGANGDRR